MKLLYFTHLNLMGVVERKNKLKKKMMNVMLVSSSAHDNL